MAVGASVVASALHHPLDCLRGHLTIKTSKSKNCSGLWDRDGRCIWVETDVSIIASKTNYIFFCSIVGHIIQWFFVYFCSRNVTLFSAYFYSLHLEDYKKVYGSLGWWMGFCKMQCFLPSSSRFLLFKVWVFFTDGEKIHGFSVAEKMIIVTKLGLLLFFPMTIISVKLLANEIRRECSSSVS